MDCSVLQMHPSCPGGVKGEAQGWNPRCSDHTLVFLCEFRPSPGSPPAADVDHAAGTQSSPVFGRFGPEFVEVTVPAQCSIQQLRLRLCLKAQEQSCHPNLLGLLDPEQYLLLYARGQEWYEMYDDCQVLRTLDVPWSRQADGRLAATIAVTPVAAADDGERQRQQALLATLIGHDLDREATNRLGELMVTRRKLASPRRQELKLRDNVVYATEPWTTTAPLPRDLQPHGDRSLKITLHYLQKLSFSMEVNPSITPQLLLELCNKVTADQGLECRPSDSLVLKVTGREEFLSGDFRLLDFLWVRKCLKSSRDLHLSVLSVTQLPQEAVLLADWPLVDSFTGQSSSHDDLRLEGKDLDDIFMISLWDCDRKFRFKLTGIDIPKLPAKAPPSVYVEASIIYGNKVLLSVASTTKSFADEVLWNEWLEFSVLLSDLPRGAKLGLTVNACSNETASDHPQKGKGGTLFFVNLLLIDHRSLLSQGPYNLHMWPYLGQEGEVVTYQADRLSSATNPDVTHCMAISLLLDRYSFPVVLPNGATSPESRWPPAEARPPPASPLCGTVSPVFRPGSAGLERVQTSEEITPSGSPVSLESRTGEPTISGDFPDNFLPRLPVSPETPPDAEEINRTSHLHRSTASLSSFCPSSTSDAASRITTTTAPGCTIYTAPVSTSSTAPVSTSSTTPGSTSSPASSQHSVRTPQSPTADLPGVAANAPTASIGSDKAHLKRFGKEQSVHYTANLPTFLRSVDWLKRNVVEDVHWLLEHLEPEELDLSVALELLSFDSIDESVRRLVVQRLESLSNDEVLMYLLQLVQTLKVEPYHDSFLACFLLQRALRSKRIGHFFFWYMRSEVAACPYFRQRMALVLEAYLLGCGQAMLDGFSLQVQAAQALQQVALQVKEMFPDKTDLPPTAALQVQGLLERSDLPKEFLVPFDPRVKAGAILLKSCKVMASKKKPLWLEFQPMPSPSPTPPLGILFKEGDDLRQDMLVLQTLVVMDSIWQEKSLDLNLVPYGCIATGHNIGMIEIVRKAVTIAAVQRSEGGTHGAFKNDAIFNWLRGKCPLQEIHFRAMDMFVTSCAGYCVATYVLGIGDRHNDNIMITNQGNLFHIDFGHILGNRKSFLGVRRERVPFVLTPDFLYVIGGVKGRDSLCIQRFKDICTEAYLSLHSQSRLLVTLFSLMLLTGIPELSAAEDMRYLREALQQERSEEHARDHFLQQIATCENLGWTVQANWWIHMLVGIK
ncbi:phosphatidylinositol 4,5-bisphosphate 3-kinase catalytic subunit gamma isoform [Gadus morhua]|uniref:phosphatidylinositol 4,5-bisphosphate 3-kinase catalytic subunit gamma isoform n=1 Tax=Gadus morhua TaxID=8049 RepID=UPI0011B48416|nr:phosphatidylinositol 4,5-bisphosphate 3-kinase catalytic subunit gamma isoform-like [Gadus morhua]